MAGKDRKGALGQESMVPNDPFLKEVGGQIECCYQAREGDDAFGIRPPFAPIGQDAEDSGKADGR